MKHNFARLQDHIKQGDVATLIWDSIQVSHAMGLDYVWLDAVCIGQGNFHDWEREARRMFEITHTQNSPST